MFALVKCVFILCAAVAASGYDLGDLDVIFHLFTWQNPTVSQPLTNSVNSIMSSSLSLNRRTFITIHSNGEDVSGNFNAFVVPAILSSEDVNLLAVDWSAGSSMYSYGLGNAPQCGERIAQFINILVSQFGYNPNLISIVGVGLGGHIAGIAARQINGIPHIVAIDPSFFGWTHHPDILNADDADVVEVLHTTAGVLGYDYPLGDIDFYPNGGINMNGCGADVSCSHTYGYAYYAESITSESNGGNAFVGTACASYEEAISQSCTGARDAIFGGTGSKTGVSGIYTFETSFVPPFALG